jgi:hypothetical protein
MTEQGQPKLWTLFGCWLLPASEPLQRDHAVLYPINLSYGWRVETFFALKEAEATAWRQAFAQALTFRNFAAEYDLQVRWSTMTSNPWEAAGLEWCRRRSIEPQEHKPW